MKKSFITVLSVLMMTGCYIAPDTGFDEDIDKALTYDTKKGSGFLSEDGGAFTHHNGVSGNTYILTVEELGDYTFTSDDSSYVKTRKIDNTTVEVSLVNIPDGGVYDVEVRAISGGETKANAFFTAGIYKTTAMRQLDGVAYRLEFIDNFNDMTFLKNNWITEWTTDGAGNLKRPYWRNDALEVRDNTLAMLIKKDPNGYEHFTTKAGTDPNKTSYIAGGIHQKDPSTGAQTLSVKGYVEARIKMSKKSPNHWNAFWSYHASPQADIGNSIAYEFDVVEYADTSASFEQTTHWWNKTGGRYISSRTHHVDIGEVGWTEWHTVGMLWTDNEIVYYRDGVETARMYKNGTANPSEFAVNSTELAQFATDGQEFIPSFPQNWKFTTELGSFGNDSDGTAIDALLDASIEGEDVMYVDYFVRYVPA